MKKTKINHSFAPAEDISAGAVVSLHPHNHPKQPARAVFGLDGHNPDTIALAATRMRPPSRPKVNSSNSRDIYIYWNHDVPVELWKLHNRKRERIRKRNDINDFTGVQQQKRIDFWLKVWTYCLDHLRYSPFDEELMEYRRLKEEKSLLIEEITQLQNVPEEQKRMDSPIDHALLMFINSRLKRKLDSTSISSYQGTVDWLNHSLSHCGHGNVTIGKLKHIHISEALDYTAEEREWSAGTINKQVGFVMTIFNWLETEDYVVKNPSRKKFVKLPTNKSKHRWYDREIKPKVKVALVNAGKMNVYRAMQFTYWILIRSKAELRKLRIGDIDRTLKRVRFTSDLSKNKSEQYRDYTEEFEKVLDEMELDRYPEHYYVFGGGGGTPGEQMVGANFFSNQFRPIKEKLGLSADYTIYGMKHTRMVHELMRGTDGLEIMHMARHSDFKTTKEYLRDYDITLRNIYGPEDLTF